MSEYIHTKSHELFDIIIALSAQYKIKSRTTPITIELLEHDYDLDDKIKLHIDELGALIEEAVKINTEINPEFIKLYQMYKELHPA
jgi:hypothetical protein